MYTGEVGWVQSIGDFEQTARNLETQMQKSLLTVTARQKLCLRFQGCGLFAQTPCCQRCSVRSKGQTRFIRWFGALSGVTLGSHPKCGSPSLAHLSLQAQFTAFQ